MSVTLESAHTDGPSAVILVAQRDCARYDFASFHPRSVSILGVAEERWIALNTAFFELVEKLLPAFDKPPRT
jgi:hypothetical protein